MFTLLRKNGLVDSKKGPLEAKKRERILGLIFNQKEIKTIILVAQNLHTSH